MISKKPLISEIEYFSSAYERAWEYLKEQSPHPVHAQVIGRVVLGLETSINELDETQHGYMAIYRLRKVVPKYCIQTTNQGYIFIDGSGEGELSQSTKQARKKAFSEAAEMVESLYVTCGMPMTEIVKHLKMAE